MRVVLLIGCSDKRMKARHLCCHRISLKLIEIRIHGKARKGGGGGWWCSPPPPSFGFEKCFYVLVKEVGDVWWIPLLSVWQIDPILFRKEKKVTESPPPSHYLYQAWRCRIDHGMLPPPPLEKAPAYATVHGQRSFCQVNFYTKLTKWNARTLLCTLLMIMQIFWGSKLCQSVNFGLVSNCLVSNSNLNPHPQQMKWYKRR